MYLDKGDHVGAGDFHYGEMEMKRREYGGIRKWFCLEFLYWLLSGYGTGYVRAAAFLLSLISLFGWFYFVYGGIALQHSFEKSLLLSLQVGTLQKPTFPYAFSVVGEWLYMVETIVVPVQAALFILALRMRMKR